MRDVFAFDVAISPPSETATMLSNRNESLDLIRCRPAHRAIGVVDATEATRGLIWFNVGHLFSVSLLPFSTAWMAVSELAPQPVACYAVVFFLVNVIYVLLIWELIGRRPVATVARKVRRVMLTRAAFTLGLFAAAAVLALWFPIAALIICGGCLVVYLKPEAPDL